MKENLSTLLGEIAGCAHCAAHLPLGPRPVVRAAPTARLMIVGQAPGTRVHESGIPFNDRSGDRLRDWLQMPPEVFYDSSKVAIVPMGFCYPGVDARGGDLPPRPECAPLWHPRLMPHLRELRLTLLVGQYAQARYLGKRRARNLTETVRAWADYLPEFVPLPHPSWRTTGWQKKNPWFDAELLPELRRLIGDALAGATDVPG
ncbi:MAG TPA: uracil-DNA glycosylase family protein [Devosiaceae bacterium]